MEMNKVFKDGLWSKEINVSDFVYTNITPYEGDASFLAGPTERTKKVWNECLKALEEERANNGVRSLDNVTVSTITSHKAGYIDRENELIVGLQTDELLRRACLLYTSKTYVPDHEFGSHKEEEDARPRGYMRHIHINHGPELERSIEEVKKAISQNEDIRHKYSTRFLSIKLLENDKEIENFISTLPNGKEIIAIRNKETLRIRKVMNEDSEQAITDAKYGFITGALKLSLIHI